MRFVGPLSLLLAVTLASPAVLEHVELEDRSLFNCKNNPALSAISNHKASPFCTSWLNISTQTSTFFNTTTSVVPFTTSSHYRHRTKTIFVTATETDTETETDTSTVFLPGVLTTQTATSTATFTTTFTSTITTTSTTTSTTTTYNRKGPLKRDLEALEERNLEERATPTIPKYLSGYQNAVISTACSCYVTTPTTNVTSTVTATSTSTSLVDIPATITITAETDTATVFATVTNTRTRRGRVTTISTTAVITTTSITNTTVTSTTVATATATANGGTFSLVQQYSGSCVPYNYQVLDINTGLLNYNAAFQYCANLCETATSYKCVQIFVGYNGPFGGGSYTCITGGGPDYKTWTFSEFHCHLQSPYPKYGIWYAPPPS